VQNASENIDNIFKDTSVRRRRAAPKLRVLVVDDEPSILEVLKAALTSLENYDVSVANSAAAALKLIDRQKEPFDCLLLDIQMPDKNGIDLCKEIRGNRAYRDTPIVMLTAMTDRVYVDRAFAAGATDFLSKPFDFFELRNRMTSAQRLIKERKLAGVGMEVARKLKAELDTAHKFELSDAISFSDVDRMLQSVEFTNYVLQLSRGYLFNSHATAIRVVGATDLHKSLDANMFRKGLHDVATALALVTKRSGDLFTYRGNGIFLLIGHARSSESLESSAGKLNQLIETLHAQRQAESSFGVEIGERQSMRSLTKSGTLSLLQKATENFEIAPQPEPVKSEPAKSEPVKPGFIKRALKTPEPVSTPRNGDQRIYEKTLRDIFREDSRLQSS